MACSYDKRAEEFLRRTLEHAAESGLTTRGGHMRFPVSPGKPITERILQDYCSQWMDPVTPPSKVEAGWRPRIVPEDNTVVYIVSNDAINCQGRVETVQALAVIAAGLVCRIPSEIVMACPSAADFWNWTEKNRVVVKISRPPSTLLAFVDDDEKTKTHQKPLQLSSLTTSRCITEYLRVIVDDKARVMMEEQAKPLEEVDMKYMRPPSMDEAERLMNESLEIVTRDMEANNMCLRTTMQHPHTISVGQMIAYCKKIYYDSEVYHLGTRWRPAKLNHLMTSRKKEIKGGLYLYDSAFCVDGSAAMALGLAPVVAALRIRLDPDMARNTHAFRDFYSLVDYEHSGRNFLIQQPYMVLSDWEPRTDWRRDVDDEEFASNRFAQEEAIMGIAMKYLRSSFVKSIGQYQGSEAFRHVQWSQEDFVNNLLLWWPEAEIQSAGHFRYTPNGLDRGGLRWFHPGSYFSAQGRAAWQGALMPMIASLICGIPAEIAALLKASDLFWYMIYSEHGGTSTVQYHRDRIRVIRDKKYGSSWDQKRSAMRVNEPYLITPAVKESASEYGGWNRGRKNDSWSQLREPKQDSWSQQVSSNHSDQDWKNHQRWSHQCSAPTGGWTNNHGWSHQQHSVHTSGEGSWPERTTTRDDGWYQHSNHKTTWSEREESVQTPEDDGWSQQRQPYQQTWPEREGSVQTPQDDGWNQHRNSNDKTTWADREQRGGRRDEQRVVIQVPSGWNREYFSASKKISYEELFAELSQRGEAEICLSSRIQTMFDVSEYLCEAGKAIVGSAAPPWSLINTPEFLVCLCKKQAGEIRLVISPKKICRIVGSCCEAMIGLAAAICSDMDPSEIPSKCIALTDWMVENFLSGLSPAEVQSKFTQVELAKVKPRPIENRPPRNGRITWETRTMMWDEEIGQWTKRHE